MIYEGNYAEQISFPLGGIGTGSIGLTGIGGFQDWEIFNRPDKGSVNGYTHLAVRARTPEKTVCKVLHGDLNTGLHGTYLRTWHTGYGTGADKYTLAGMPHFRRCVFDGRFPLAKLTFTDDAFPGTVTLAAFNPFIPLNSRDSSLPAAFFELTFRNDTDRDVEYTGVFALCNPFAASENQKLALPGCAGVQLRHADIVPEDPAYGDLTLACPSPTAFAQTYWFRGDWQDALVTYWNELTGGQTFPDRQYDTPAAGDTCTVGDTVVVPAGQCRTIRFLLTWNVPNAYNYWDPYLDADGKDVTWRNYYATQFPDSTQTAAYGLAQWDRLRQETVTFTEELYAASLDPAIIEAISATISVLKSPTVLRLENGDFYGWEGTLVHEGSCEGTCQHVWNYAYALCFLFPDLERSIRRQEFTVCTEPSGRMQFRMLLPRQRKQNDWRACLDGQMGAVIKTCREWKLSGDDDFLRAFWPQIQSVLAYAWSPENEDQWDPNKDGVLEGRQHHTLDRELFGPSGWLQGFYFAALKAAAEMADYLGESEKAAEYRTVYESGLAWCTEHLFNGSWFIQKIDLNDKSIVDRFDAVEGYWNPETREIKYQIGEGSSIDQLCGQWHADLCGLGQIFDKAQTQTAIRNLFVNNFKPSLREFANPWRIYALNDEASAIICDYPAGARKPKIPIPYCEESMHGFEYQLAGLLIRAGMVEEGVTIVKAIRNRYDGHKRNPWNEMECGSNYARSMASFALLPLSSGFSFDLPHGRIGFDPVAGGNFRFPFFTGTAWGRVTGTAEAMTLTLQSGSLRLRALEVPAGKTVRSLTADGQPLTFAQECRLLTFPEVTFCKSLQVEWA